jgi:hypothetical protein
VDPETFLRRYRKLPESPQGRFVAADLMKETFDAFVATKESRLPSTGGLPESDPLAQHP